MRKFIVVVVMLLSTTMSSLINAQIVAPKFGKGIQISAQDSSFYMKVGLRFQTLLSTQWNLENDELGSLEDYQSAFFIRRSRLKFDGWAVNPNFKYKVELALSNRDNGGGNSSEFSNAANIILDASVEYKFYKNVSIWAGQGKLPGNRERIISSGNLQFVDRSRLNSRYTLDRDVALMLKNYQNLNKEFILKETFAISSGEGKNVTSGNVGGYAYTFKVEALPFGNFASKGDYIGSAVQYETKPKLAVAIAYDINQNAGRERGQKGDFITDDRGDHYGKNLNTLFADLMFKYQNFSIMAEYANRKTEDGDANVIANGAVIGTYYTGTGTNLAIGYMMDKNVELALRWTSINPSEGVASDENRYTMGLSKYVVGHKLKVQSDLTYRAIATSEDDLIFRMQMDLHF